MNELKYQEFNRLRRELINRLQSIEEGSLMNSLCDDSVQEIRVIDQVETISEQMNVLADLAQEISECEGL